MYIAQTKDKCGFEKRENYNLGTGKRVPQCPPEKEKAIMAAFRYFRTVSYTHLASELKHCIIAHHGELEYGSPKKPALAEAMALNFADCTDAKMQTLTEIFKDKNGKDWIGRCV